MMHVCLVFVIVTSTNIDDVCCFAKLMPPLYMASIMCVIIGVLLMELYMCCKVHLNVLLDVILWKHVCVLEIRCMPWFLCKHLYVQPIVVNETTENQPDTRPNSVSYIKYDARTETRCQFEERMENTHSPNKAEEQVYKHMHCMNSMLVDVWLTIWNEI